MPSVTVVAPDVTLAGALADADRDATRKAGQGGEAGQLTAEARQVGVVGGAEAAQLGQGVAPGVELGEHGVEPFTAQARLDLGAQLGETGHAGPGGVALRLAGGTTGPQAGEPSGLLGRLDVVERHVVGDAGHDATFDVRRQGVGTFGGSCGLGLLVERRGDLRGTVSPRLRLRGVVGHARGTR